MPATYVKLTAETGRGRVAKSPSEEADYFAASYADYLQYLRGATPECPGSFEGMNVLEYGPGNILGTALLLCAYGARRVDCVDQFPLTVVDSQTVEVYRALYAGLPSTHQLRGGEAFSARGDSSSGFNEKKIRYFVRPEGLSGAAGEYDAVLSRAVLEHVSHLPSTFMDMFRALRPGGIAIHKVDLTSHGLDRCRPLDFLTWPTWLYRCMYGRKGYPNRCRVSVYKTLASDCGFEIVSLEPTGHFPKEDVAFIRPRISSDFRCATPEELEWKGFWMVLRKPA